MPDEHTRSRPSAGQRDPSAGVDPLPPTERPSDAEREAAPPDEGPKRRRATRPDPTRYGDWEKDGRCIDF